jgi:hypothetical protein
MNTYWFSYLSFGEMIGKKKEHLMVDSATTPAPERARLGAEM